MSSLCAPCPCQPVLRGSGEASRAGLPQTGPRLPHTVAGEQEEEVTVSALAVPQDGWSPHWLPAGQLGSGREAPARMWEPLRECTLPEHDSSCPTVGLGAIPPFKHKLEPMHQHTFAVCSIPSRECILIVDIEQWAGWCPLWISGRILQVGGLRITCSLQRLLLHLCKTEADGVRWTCEEKPLLRLGLLGRVISHMGR